MNAKIVEFFARTLVAAVTAFSFVMVVTTLRLLPGFGGMEGRPGMVLTALTCLVCMGGIGLASTVIFRDVSGKPAGANMIALALALAVMTPSFQTGTTVSQKAVSALVSAPLKMHERTIEAYRAGLRENAAG